MDRKEFLRTMGLGLAVISVGSCLGGCSESVSGPTNVDFTLDLSLPANSALNTIGGAIVNAGVIVARTGTNEFTAVAASCPHEGQRLSWQQSAGEFHCSRHGSNFSKTGAVLNGPASSDVSTYKTTLTGTSLRVFS